MSGTNLLTGGSIAPVKDEGRGSIRPASAYQIDARAEIGVFHPECETAFKIALGNDVGLEQLIKLVIRERLEKDTSALPDLESGGPRVTFERIEPVCYSVTVLMLGRRYRGIMTDDAHFDGNPA